MDQPSDYIRVVERAVPPGYLRDTTAIVVKAYQAASESARERFCPEVAHDLVPHLRRALIEEDWLALASRYPGVVAAAAPNRVGSSFHTLVRCGPVVITASKVDSPEDLPRHALFRKTYARRPQLVLDLPGIAAPPEAAAPEDADGLYALLTHGPDERDAGRPAFVRLGIPTPTCSGYVAVIDLLARYGGIVAPTEVGATDGVEVTPAEPTLRRPLRRKEQGA